jgi:hypothetical protein
VASTEKFFMPPGLRVRSSARREKGGSGLSRRLPREACRRVGLASAPDRRDLGLAFAASSRGSLPLALTVAAVLRSLLVSVRLLPAAVE